MATIIPESQYFVVARSEMLRVSRGTADPLKNKQRRDVRLMRIKRDRRL